MVDWNKLVIDFEYKAKVSELTSQEVAKNERVCMLEWVYTHRHTRITHTLWDKENSLLQYKW